VKFASLEALFLFIQWVSCCTFLKIHEDALFPHHVCRLAVAMGLELSFDLFRSSDQDKLSILYKDPGSSVFRLLSVRFRYWLCFAYFKSSSPELTLFDVDFNKNTIHYPLQWRMSFRGYYNKVAPNQDDSFGMSVEEIKYWTQPTYLSAFIHQQADDCCL